MSSFGYNGDISNSTLSGRSGFSENSIDGDGNFSGLNHFVHGMHSFNTANQLQYYLGRMAPPGARVNITHVAHNPSRSNRAAISHPPNQSSAVTSESSSQVATPLSRSPVFTPAPPAPPPSPAFTSSDGNRLALNQPPNALMPSAGAPLVVGPAMVNFQTNPPPPGYERKHMMVICHLHDREGTPEQTGDHQVMNPFGSARSGPSYSEGYCSICRRVVRVDSRGRLF